MSRRESHPRPPLAPTSAAPGSPAKIEVLRSRLERGEHLHHPEDERCAVHRIRYQPNPGLMRA